MKLFICYRREDASGITGRIYEHLEKTFGKGNIFEDINAVPEAADFRKEVGKALQQADIFIVIIGPRWLTIADKEGRRRLDAHDDYVRGEIEMALLREIPIIPLLVERASMPGPDDLPPSLRELSFRGALSIRDDPDFKNDINRLQSRIHQLSHKKKS